MVLFCTLFSVLKYVDMTNNSKHLTKAPADTMPVRGPCINIVQREVTIQAKIQVLHVKHTQWYVTIFFTQYTPATQRTINTNRPLSAQQCVYSTRPTPLCQNTRRAPPCVSTWDARGLRAQQASQLGWTGASETLPRSFGPYQLFSVCAGT